MFVLHGILGRRANWRSFMRRWLPRRPGWGTVLVDLREHGESQGFAPPHTIDAAGGDLVELRATIEAEQGGRVAGLMGHSFGGKVAISGAAALRRAGAPVDELWVLDAPPGPRDPSTEGLTDGVFAALGALPPEFANRSDFVAALTADGIAKMTAQWLATNLVEDAPGQWRFGLDLDDMRALIRDFGRHDAWPTLEREAAEGTSVHLVVGARSDAVPDGQLERARRWAGAGGLELAVVPDAGHWLHVEAPEALLEALAGAPAK